MSGFFEDENARASKFREVLREHDIDIVAATIDYIKCTTDGDQQLKGFRYLIVEIKNEIGSKGAEPHAQAISYYIRSTKSFASDKPGFRFPCILITLFGKFPVSRISLSTDHNFYRAPH